MYIHRSSKLLTVDSFSAYSMDVYYHDFGCGVFWFGYAKLGQYLPKDGRVERIFLYFLKWKNADWLANLLHISFKPGHF